jgi:DNA repair exonuclease SbcCD ATPase subunit
MMDDLINPFAQYFGSPDSLSSRISELDDINEYNQYIRQKMEESVLIEEEILSLNQNQPILEQMNQLFTTQEANLERIRIQIFDESSVIHDELKEIKEIRANKMNIEPQLNKVKNSLISYIILNWNKMIELHSELEKLPSVFNSSFFNLLQTINQIKDNLETMPNKETFQLIINDNATTIINEF